LTQGIVRRLLPILILLVLVASVQATAQTEVPPAGGIELPKFSVNVTKTSLKILVYPDGSVQPLYSVEAYSSLGESRLTGKLTLTSESSYVSGESTSRTVLRANFVGLDADSEQQASIEAEGSYRFAKGDGEATLSARLAVAGNESYTLDLKKLTVRLIDARQLVIEAEALVPSKLLEEEVGSEKLPSLEEVNRELARSGFGYIRVDRLAVEVSAGGSSRVAARVVIDLEGMLQAAIANGMSPDDAATLRKLLAAPYSVQGEFSLKASLYVGGDRLRASLDYRSSSRGDLEQISRLAAESRDAMNALVVALLRPLLAKNPEVLIAVNQVQGLQGMTSAALLVKPPSESMTRIELVASNGLLRLSADYRGPRLYVPASTPSAAAEKALAALSTQYQQILATLGQLEILAPGVSNLLPMKIVIEPADPCVKVSKTSVTAAQLATVQVDLSACKTKTTTAATKTVPVATTATAAQPAEQGKPGQAATATSTTGHTAEAPSTKSPTARPQTAEATAGTRAETATSPEAGQTTPTGVLAVAALAALAAAVILALMLRR